MAQDLKYSTYLFDFDGTLVDSMPVFAAVMTGILKDHGVSYPDNVIEIITPMGYAGSAEYFRRLGMDMPVSDIVEIINTRALYEYEHTILLKAGVKDTLLSLRQRGASLNILTASPHLMLDPCLKRLGIWELFDRVWSSDDFGMSKRVPEIYISAAERMGKKVGDVLFVDDNIHADAAAKQAGMWVCGIYDPSSEALREDMRALCHHYIDTMPQLPEL